MWTNFSIWYNGNEYKRPTTEEALLSSGDGPDTRARRRSGRNYSRGCQQLLICRSRFETTTSLVLVEDVSEMSDEKIIFRSSAWPRRIRCSYSRCIYCPQVGHIVLEDGDGVGASVLSMPVRVGGCLTIHEFAAIQQKNYITYFWDENKMLFRAA